MSSPRPFHSTSVPSGRPTHGPTKSPHFAQPGSPASAFKTNSWSPKGLGAFMSRTNSGGEGGGVGLNMFKQRGQQQFVAFGGGERASMHPPSPLARSSPPQHASSPIVSPATPSSRVFSAYASDSPLKRKVLADEDDESIASVKHTRSSSPASHGHAYTPGSYHSDDPSQTDEYDQLQDDGYDDQHSGRSVSPPSSQARGPSPSLENRPDVEQSIPPSDGTIVDDYLAQPDNETEVEDDDDREDASSRVETEAGGEPDAVAKQVGQAPVEDQHRREQSDQDEAAATRAVSLGKEHAAKTASSAVEAAKEVKLHDNPYSRLYLKISKSDAYLDAEREFDAKWAAIDADDTETWEQGGQGLIAKARAILDRVKDHVNDRIELYETVEECVDVHKDELAHNASELASTQEHLREWGDNIVSSVNIGAITKH